jgi:hypothetical protein
MAGMTSGMTNSRSGLPQPGTIASKTSSLSHTTRARSATQAPEPSRSGTGSLPPSRPGTSMGRVHTRTNSYASSTLTRSASTASRTTRTNFSSTVGPGSRPPSHAPRPHTSLAGPRKPTGHSITRPATSLDTHEEEDFAASILGKRKGRRQSLFSLLDICSLPASITPHSKDRKMSCDWSGLARNGSFLVSKRPLCELTNSGHLHVLLCISRKRTPSPIAYWTQNLCIPRRMDPLNPLPQRSPYLPPSDSR